MKTSRIAKQLKDRSGVTLIEIIVGFVIAAIFATVAIALLSPINNTYNRTTEKAQAQLLANNLIEEIRGKTNICNTLASAQDGKAISYDQKIIKPSEEGYLMIDGQLTYPASYYDGNTITLQTKDTQKANQVEVHMEVKDEDNKVLFTLDTVLQPILFEDSESDSEYRDYAFDKMNDPTRQLDALLANMQSGFDALYKQYPEMVGKRENPIESETNYSVKYDGKTTNIIFFQWIEEQGYGANIYQFAKGEAEGAALDLKVLFTEDDKGIPTGEIYSIYYKVGDDRAYLIYSNGNKYWLPKKTYDIAGRPYLKSEQKLLSYPSSYYLRI